MKTNKYIRLAAMLPASLALLLASCDDNSWNDHELDGFEEPGITDQQSIDYTLTANDYKLIADNSTNKALAGDALASELKAVGTQCYFTPGIQARDYVPALLSDPKFQYFTLTDGSSIKLTYRTAAEIPAEVTAAASALRYTVTDEDYQKVWGSDNDYTPSFAPSHTAASSLPAILLEALPDAEAGDYVIVNYETSATDPVFNAPADPDTPEYTLSSVIGTMAAGDDVTVNGYVSALCTGGFILTDASGSVFVYRGGSFGADGYGNLTVGSRVVVNGTAETRNKGFQFGQGATVEVQPGEQEFEYPAAQDWTGAKLEEIIARSTDELAIYGRMTGTVKVGDTNINILVDGAGKAQGSPYYVSDEDKALLVDGSKVTIEGYLIAIAGGRYCSTVVTKITSAASTASTASSSRAVTVASQNENAIYTFNGSRWSAASDFAVLSHADYQDMGQRYDNLSNDGPATYLPIYLKKKYPYAQADDARFVVYFYYDSSTTSVRCDQYLFNGTEWVINDGVTTETSQFVRTGGKWIYDPNVTITLPGGKGQELSTLYYQTCVDWVKTNIDAPTGATYVTSYGNNEYYSGTSAYQGNVDIRPTAARTQYAEGYAGMSDEQVVEAMKRRFETEVMPGALAVLHPEAAPIEGIDVYYTINFVAYDGKSNNYVIKFKVTSPGTFEFVECDW